MMTAVAETEKEQPSVWGMGMVAIAICVRFLHSLAQKELSVMVMSVYSEASPAILTLILSFVQVSAALSVFQANGLNIYTVAGNREAAIIGLLAYTGSLYLNNYLLWNDDSAALACYGVLEPVLCILVLFIAARITTETYKAASVAGFSLGAALLTAHFTLIGNVNCLLRILASLYLLVGNMVIKHLYDNSVNFLPRKQNTIVLVALSGTVMAVLMAVLLSRQLLIASVMAVVAGILSVTFLFFMFTMLSLYDTLTVSVFMLWSQVLENVIFLVDSSRPGIPSILIGAVLFAAGHYVYFKDGLESGTVHLNIKEVGSNELFTRLQFILYAGSIVGVIASLLQPYISERDVSLLSFVGLDRFARKLLNVQPEQVTKP